VKKWKKITISLTATAFSLAIIGSIFISHKFANSLIHNPIEKRTAFYTDHPEWHLDTLLNKHNLKKYEEVRLTTDDDFNLEALYFPSENGAAIIILHGYKHYRFAMIYVAAMLVDHGYGAILPILRAHGNSDGELLTFGFKELQDIYTAFRYLLNRTDVNPEKIGLLGQSMGGALAILYAAENTGIKAIVVEGPYDSFDNTLSTTIKKFTGLPPFPFVPTIKYFIERQLGFRLKEYDPIDFIARISPRPVFIMTGGKDTFVNPTAGKNLAEAVGEHCQFWFEPEFEHVDFSLKNAEEFENRVVDFFDKHLIVNQ